MESADEDRLVLEVSSELLFEALEGGFSRYCGSAREMELRVGIGRVGRESRAFSGLARLAGGRVGEGEREDSGRLRLGAIPVSVGRVGENFEGFLQLAMIEFELESKVLYQSWHCES